MPQASTWGTRAAQPASTLAAPPAHVPLALDPHARPARPVPHGYAPSLSGAVPVGVSVGVSVGAQPASHGEQRLGVPGPSLLTLSGAGPRMYYDAPSNSTGMLGPGPGPGSGASGYAPPQWTLAVASPPSPRQQPPLRLADATA